MLAGPGFALCWPLFRCAALSVRVPAQDASFRLAVALLRGQLHALDKFEVARSLEPHARLCAALVPSLNVVRCPAALQPHFSFATPCRGLQLPVALGAGPLLTRLHLACN